MKLTANIHIETDRDTLWDKSQNPAEHVLWDLRFTEIEYLAKDREDDPQRFRYATRLGFGLAVTGWGESVGDPGKKTSALKFGSDDPKSLIRKGAGSWTYKEEAKTVRFSTVYDYQVRYGVLGRLIDFLFFRPLMLWAVRWSFDRLKIWIERGTHPAVSMRLWLTKVIARVALALLWIHEGIVPKIAAVRASELELVANSGLVIGTPRTTLLLLGLAEIGAGLWLLSGKAERWAAVLLSIAMVAIAALVLFVDPAAWTNPFGGISKNIGLLACAFAVWILSPICPSAQNAKPERRTRK
jgi:uncharacterized membrane protein YphA (DoxX/SURF4 family)